MDLKDIQDLIKFVAKSGATEVDLEIDNVKISIKSPPKKRRGETKNENEDITSIIREVPTVIKEVPTTVPAEKNSQPEQITKTTEEKISENNSSEESNYLTIKASMIGTFYRSSSPENPPFINVGDSIKEGDIILKFNGISIEKMIDLRIDQESESDAFIK